MSRLDAKPKKNLSESKRIQTVLQEFYGSTVLHDIIQDSTRITSRLLWIAIAGCSQVSPVPGLYELRLGATKLLQSGQLKPLGLNVRNPNMDYGDGVASAG